MYRFGFEADNYVGEARDCKYCNLYNVRAAVNRSRLHTASGWSLAQCKSLIIHRFCLILSCNSPSFRPGAFLSSFARPRISRDIRYFARLWSDLQAAGGRERTSCKSKYRCTSTAVPHKAQSPRRRRWRTVRLSYPLHAVIMRVK